MLRLFRSGIDFLKKAFLVVGVFFIIFAIFGYVINGNRPRYDEKKILQASQKQLYDTLSRERIGIKKGSGKDLVLSLYKMGYCAVMGELCTEKLTYGNTHFKSSLMGQVSNMISMTYTNPPASGVYWVTNTLQNAGFIPQSYAAEGMGFAMIKPLMNLWKIFRDIAYLIIVIILIAVGFMIMFRTKINPQTVISVENSLPKVVVALLLITFSFAIAGFLIDLMYLLIILTIGILSNNNTYYDANQVQNVMLNSNLGTLWDMMLPLPTAAKELMGWARFSYVGDAFMTLLPQSINSWSHIVAIGLGTIFGGQLIVKLLSDSGIFTWLNNINLAGTGLGTFPQVVMGIVFTPLIFIIIIQIIINGFGFFVGFIVSLSIFGMMCTIFFTLLKSYIQITISIIFSPIILLFEALPGNNNFSFWVKGMLGELLTFPIVITLLLVEKIMFMTMTYPGDFWVPPFLKTGELTNPINGSTLIGEQALINPAGFSIIFGVGLILITPDIIKLVKEAVGAKPLPFNIGVGTFMSGSGAIVGGGMGILQQFSTLSMGIRGMSEMKGMFATQQQKDAAKIAENARIQAPKTKDGKPQTT